MNKGFTLVELAIVMTIIGLLIGGVLQGQQLLRNARATSQIKQFQQIEAGTITFRDTYGYLPGDMPNARARLPGCNTANSCVNGSGNSVVGRSTGAFENSQTAAGALPGVETTMFWKHLALANLINGIDTSAALRAPQWGKTHPSSHFNGGLMIGFNDSDGGVVNTPETGHFILMHSNINGNIGGQFIASQALPLSAMEAYIIDLKIDDGKPNLGSVIVEYIGSRCKTSDEADAVYETSNNDAACFLWYKPAF